MPDWNLVRRQHVLAAMKECDNLGSREFLRRYGFGRARGYTLWHQGQEYDSKAILGVAYFHATGAAASSDEFSRGEHGAAKVLEGLGFDIAVDEQELATEKPQRAKSTKPKRASARDATPKVCPTCHMAIPASGICDFCD